MAQDSVQNGILVTPGGLVLTGKEKTMLRWNLDFGRAGWKRAGPRILDGFVALWRDEEPKRVIAFAEKWGALKVNRRCNPADLTTGTEPLRQWWFLSRRAHAVLNLARALQVTDDGDEDDWAMLSFQHHGINHPPQKAAFYGLPNWARAGYADKRRRLEHSRAVIAGEVSEWLRLFHVGMRFEWDGRGPRLATTFWDGRVLSAIALQLAMRVANAARLFNCSWCGSLYTRNNRAPNEGQKNYCIECVSKRVPQRVAEAASRKRKREQNSPRAAL